MHWFAATNMRRNIKYMQNWTRDHPLLIAGCCSCSVVAFGGLLGARCLLGRGVSSSIDQGLDHLEFIGSAGVQELANGLQGAHTNRHSVSGGAVSIQSQEHTLMLTSRNFGGTVVISTQRSLHVAARAILAPSLFGRFGPVSVHQQSAKISRAWASRF